MKIKILRNLFFFLLELGTSSMEGWVWIRNLYKPSPLLGYVNAEV